MVKSKDGHRHPKDGPPPQSREGQSQSREVPLHYKESQVRSRARVPTDRLLAAGEEEEPDYASIESVDGSLQEVGGGRVQVPFDYSLFQKHSSGKDIPTKGLRGLTCVNETLNLRTFQCLGL